MVKVKGKANIIEEVPVNDIITKDPNIRKFFIVEEMPIFMPEKCNDHKEGQILMQKYIVGNMIYHESASDEY